MSGHLRAIWVQRSKKIATRGKLRLSSTSSVVFAATIHPRYPWLDEPPMTEPDIQCCSALM